MEEMRVLLIDLRQYSKSPDLRSRLARICRVDVVPGHQPILPALMQGNPCGLFFDFDFPDVRRLSRLTEARRQIPQLPVVMVTEEHSEALAVWALRSRVWDYFVKPVEESALADTIAMLNRLREIAPGGRRHPYFPHHAAPAEARFYGDAPEKRALAPAVRYVAASLGKPISQKQAAAACDMSVFQFSRSFKRVFEMTFQDYVTGQRMEYACRLLRNREASISDVCWAAGFRDVSYFSRVFKRHFHQSPSTFRENWQSTRYATVELHLQDTPTDSQ